MENSFGSRLKHAWNIFLNRDPTYYQGPSYGVIHSHRPDRKRYTRGNERSIVTSIYNRIALDVASLEFQHVQLDENGRFKETRDSGLNTCLTLEANIDQSHKAFMQDIVASMFDEGVVAVVPVETSFDPNITGSYDIHTMRVGKIIEWRPRHIGVELYNERTGQKEKLLVEKRIHLTLGTASAANKLSYKNIL